MAPKAVARLQADQSPTGTAVLLIRTIGIRDLVLGAGTVAAAQAAGDEGVRSWITFGLLSDALDVVAGAISRSLVGRKAAFTAAGVPVPIVPTASIDRVSLEESPALHSEGPYVP